MAIDVNTTTKDYSLVIYNKTQIDTTLLAETTRVNGELALKSLKADEGSPSGIATLDATGKVEVVQLPLSSLAESGDAANSTTLITPERLNYQIGVQTVSVDKIGAALGIAPLGLDSIIPDAYLPPARTVATYVVEDLATMYLLPTLHTVLEGDRAVVTNEPTDVGGDLNGEWVAAANAPSSVQWAHLPNVNAVSSVNGQTGVVSVTTVAESALNKIDIATNTAALVQANIDIGTNTAQLAINTPAIATNGSNITALDVRLTAEETKVDDVISIVTTSPMTEQILAPNVPEKLEWMTTALVDSGTAISHSIANDNILINETGIYKVYGVITTLAPINDLVDIELYIDNLPTGFMSSCIGRGTNSPVTFTYAFMSSFAINDDINLYVTSTGISITLQSASVTVEKTNY